MSMPLGNTKFVSNAMDSWKQGQGRGLFPRGHGAALCCPRPISAGAPRNAPNRLRQPTNGGIAWSGSRAFPEPLPVPSENECFRMPGRQAVRGSPSPSAVLIRRGIGPKATGLGGKSRLTPHNTSTMMSFVLDGAAGERRFSDDKTQRHSAT